MTVERKRTNDWRAASQPLARLTIFVLIFATVICGMAVRAIAGSDRDSMPDVHDTFLSAGRLLASTYLGGSAVEGWIYGGEIDIAIADDGSVLATGLTASSDFPTVPGCYQTPSGGGQDIYIARFSPDLSELLSLAIIGGSADDQSPRICTYEGDIYLAGLTFSTDFPTTPGCFRSTYSGSSDMILAKFDSELTTLLASTYIGSPAFDGYYVTLAIDDLGNVFISSNTSSSTFPFTSEAYSDSVQGYNDCCVVRFSNDLSSVTAGTFIGGRFDEKAACIAINPEGQVVLATASESDDYPTTPGAYEEEFHGPPQPGEYIHDVVISVFDNDLTTLITSTYIGGVDYEGASLLAVAENGSVFIGGHTSSPDYPVSAGAFDPVHNGINEFFLSRVSADLSTIEASTYLTPDLNDQWGFVYRGDLVFDAAGNPVMVGGAFEDSAYCTPNGYDTTFNGGFTDLHVAVMMPDLSDMIYGTYVGGSGADQDAAVACTEYGDIYVTVYTTSTDFPMEGSPWQTERAGDTTDCVVVRLNMPCCGSYTEGFTGNTNCSDDGKLTLSDISRLIDRLYVSKQPLCCEANGNVNGSSDGAITLSDVSRLIDNVYISKLPTALCF